MTTDPTLTAALDGIAVQVDFLRQKFQDPRTVPTPPDILDIARRVRDASQMQTGSAMRYPVSLFKELNAALRALDVGGNG